MTRLSRLVIMAGVGLASSSLASAALPPVFFFGPPRNVIIPPVGPWIPAQPVDVDAPPLPEEPSADSRTPEPQAAIWIPAPPPEPLPYPGPGQPEES